MRIGIDARTLSGRYTGDRTYWRGLIEGLAAIDRENEYFLYRRAPVEGELPEVGPNFTWREIPTPSRDAFWMQIAFPRAVKADRIDVAHTQYNTPLFGMPCPIVTTVHDVHWMEHPEHFPARDLANMKRFLPGSLRRACRVIAVSESTRRDLLRHYKLHLTPEKVAVTPLAAGRHFAPPPGGQESAREAANTKYGLQGRPYVLSVGVLQPRKNLRLLLDAFALAVLGPAAIPHALVIVGKRGWGNDELDRRLEALPPQVRERVVLAGYVSDDDLPGLYGGADALCYPSVYEGFGLPPLEAMACGTPVIASNSSSLPEVVGDAGILLSASNSEPWARALEKVGVDPMTRERWSRRGLERASEFRWEQTAKTTLAIYRSCAKEKNE